MVGRFNKSTFPHPPYINAVITGGTLAKSHRWVLSPATSDACSESFGESNEPTPAGRIRGWQKSQLFPTLSFSLGGGVPQSCKIPPALPGQTDSLSAALVSERVKHTQGTRAATCVIAANSLART